MRSLIRHEMFDTMSRIIAHHRIKKLKAELVLNIARSHVQCTPNFWGLYT